MEFVDTGLPGTGFHAPLGETFNSTEYVSAPCTIDQFNWTEVNVRLSAASEAGLLQPELLPVWKLIADNHLVEAPLEQFTFICHSYIVSGTKPFAVIDVVVVGLPVTSAHVPLSNLY